jgi:hypothetical protein
LDLDDLVLWTPGKGNEQRQHMLESHVHLMTRAKKFTYKSTDLTPVDFISLLHMIEVKRLPCAQPQGKIRQTPSHGFSSWTTHQNQQQ